MAGLFRIGTTLSPRLLLEAELAAWTRRDDGTRQLLGGLTAVGYRAGGGGSALTALTLGVTTGIGYDLSIGDGISVTPFAGLLIAPRASLHFNGELASSGTTLAMLQGGLGIRWHQEAAEEPW